MKVLPVVAAVLLVVMIILSLTGSFISSFLDNMVIALLLVSVMFILVNSFSRHEKDVQKTTLGALIAILLSYELSYAAVWFAYLPESIAANSGGLLSAPYINTVGTAIQLLG